ncbi:replication initiation protein [Knoellia sp. 3-2P3]|uniref:replication initiator n=1 Tax=unclassified Knoellia TaxID=2618719 RepID=UPI0023DB9163|nr:replication initiator [Knoellia sp. 3-2P3]MDF2091086.1 replication initiation protein [Knoellia sp. 3-2P3]
MLAPDGAPVDVDLAYTLAANEGVCVRPLLRKVTDRATGDVRTVPIRCGSTRESACPPCATKARRVRMQQCREGWHLTEDPPLPERGLDEEPGGHEDGEDPGEVEQSQSERRVRSTRRRQDAPGLPRVPMEDRTTGQAFTAPDGTCYRPSMFITWTLPSYGKVIPGTGIPADPARYDYRRAALDALHFPKLVDRLWQNLRRCAGFKVQYFSAVEAQRRLAPHLHAAIRGAIPRKTIRQVTKATYFQLWWPVFDEVRYQGDRLPVWDREAGGYCDPHTGRALRTFRDALDELDDDPDAKPAHVVRFGQQTDVKGLLAGSKDSERAVGYLCKYLTKSVADTYADPAKSGLTEDQHTAYEAHIDRLHEQVLWLPCSPECANWLRYGIQPDAAGPGLTPGRCPSPHHDRENLGIGGRRVLVSRQWSGKTLTEHHADRAAVVRQALEAAGIEAPEADRCASDVLDDDGLPRFVWEDVPVDQRDYPAVILASVREHRAWKAQYERAKSIRDGTGPPVDDRSATKQPAVMGAAR